MQTHMRERAVLAGGELVFGPAPRRGTRIDVRVPLAGVANEGDSTGATRENEEGWDEVSDR